MDKQTLSIVVPVYNSQKTLWELYNRIKTVVDNKSIDYEVIFVDDSSNDDSWQTLCNIHQSDNRITIIRLQKNYGQHNATLCGLNYVNGEYIITLDDDLQHPPEEIPKLLYKVKEGYSVVYGIFPIKHHGWIENFLSNLFQIVKYSILDWPKGVKNSTFTVYTANVVRKMIRNKSSFIFLPALARSNTSAKKITSIEVLHQPRKEGRSNYTIRKYLSLIMNLVINYSTFPLLIIGFIGTITAFFSFIYGLQIILRYLSDSSFGVLGWRSIMVTMTFLGGLILLSIAIIGEYIRRILFEVSYGQQYVIDEMELKNDLEF